MSEGTDGDELSRMIARLSMQKACIDAAAARVAARAGFVLELGLGKGRTYDRLRRCLPGRDIYVFDREIGCPRELRPPQPLLLLGDFLQTLPGALARLGPGAVLIHADVGSRDRDRDRRLASSLAPLLSRFLVPGGVLITDRAMELATLSRLPTPQPELAPGWPYYMYQRVNTDGG